VINPARVADPAALRRLVQTVLAQDGWPEPVWLETSVEDPGGSQARLAIDAGAEVVFVGGGDGTIGAVAAELADTETVLAALPFGAGNVLARNLGLPRDVTALVRLATRGGRRRIDLGVADGQAFTVAAGIGLDAQMLAVTSSRVKRLIGWPAYGLAVLRHLHEPHFAVSLTLDRTTTIVRRVRAVVVANVGRLPGGLALVPGARPDDGRLDVVLIAPHGLRDWVRLLAAVVRRPGAPPVETFAAAEVQLVADHVQPREVDGDLIAPSDRLTVTIRPRVLTVCVESGGASSTLGGAS